MDISITSIRMVHDFPITNDYIIIPDLPLEFRPDKIFKEGGDGSVYKFDKSKCSHYAIMNKLCKD